MFLGRQKGILSRGHRNSQGTLVATKTKLSCDIECKVCTFYEDLRLESSELVFVQMDSCDVPVRLFLNLIKFKEFVPCPF